MDGTPSGHDEYVNLSDSTGMSDPVSVPDPKALSDSASGVQESKTQASGPPSGSAAPEGWPLRPYWLKVHATIPLEFD